MKSLFIVANWKSNKTETEAKDWLQRFTIYDLRFTNKEIVICSPFTALSSLKSSIINHQSSIRLGAQDVSPFDEGAFTGEINGKQIKEFADYVIIGHSERRKNFCENEEVIQKKLKMAFAYGLTPIICISRIEQVTYLKPLITNRVIVAYEPILAIGSGNADTPENADGMAAKIKQELGDVTMLYGGSVTAENVNSFRMPRIDGVLVGGSSLDVQTFFDLVKNA